MEPTRRQGALAGSIGPDNLDDEMSIDVEFEGRSPEVKDYHCIKQLLQQLFLKAPVNLSDMTSILIHQPTIGSVIKQVTDVDDEEEDGDDDDQILGITSVINITEKTSECVENLHKLILDLNNQHSDSDTTLFVNRLLSDDDNQVGLLINERYVNIPSVISVPLFQALSKEMFKLKNEKQSYNFDYLIMICKLYKVKNDKKGNKSFENSEIIWANGEEEFFDKVADYKFEFCVQNDQGSALAGSWVESDPGMIAFRRVLIFTMDKFCSLTNQLQSLFANIETEYQHES
ncbi:protein BCCIP homolog [Acyrthosiphon pisum]|uniref:Protein BCCIP homolog n=1 Tax=Acyrthosiphon pisum TaxID=7029 RepID=A0A8R1W4T3_ACYPI|nr:protein BCCIP homolog [Acyrthosiphon pisum]|eukprot:XP_003242228.1 PREDICTED: protein BCCIP homolog [Acyrthosiphon pisum]